MRYEKSGMGGYVVMSKGTDVEIIMLWRAPNALIPDLFRLELKGDTVRPYGAQKIGPCPLIRS